MRGEPNQRPNAASSAAPRFWSRNTSTGCSANTRPIQAKVASSSGLERSMPNASVPSSSPSGRSWGELVMGGPPTLSPERRDWGTGTIIGLRAVRGENRKRWVSVRPVRPSPRSAACGGQADSDQRHRVMSVRPIAADVAATRRVLDKAGPCVLVGHSYGGMIITETGMHPDIKALVYVAAVQPDVGESLSDLADKMPPAAKSIGPVGDGFLAVNPDAFPNDFAADAPKPL